MLPEKAPRKRTAYGLPPSAEAIVATASDIQKLIANGINLDGSLKAETIRALLKLQDITVSDLAKKSGYSDAFFHQVITRLRRHFVVENILADALGLEPDRIWGRKVA